MVAWLSSTEELHGQDLEFLIMLIQLFLDTKPQDIFHGI